MMIHGINSIEKNISFYFSKKRQTCDFVSKLFTFMLIYSVVLINGIQLHEGKIAKLYSMWVLQTVARHTVL